MGEFANSADPAILREIEVAYADAAAYLAPPFSVLGDGVVCTVAVSPPPFVLKIPKPRSDFDTTRSLVRESAIVDLAEAESRQKKIRLPLVIPDLLGASYYHQGRPTWFAYSLVPGEKLSRETVTRSFSATEREDFGRKLGQFVASLPRLIESNTFEREIDEINPFEGYNRLGIISRIASSPHALEDLRHGLLLAKVIDLHERYTRLKDADGLTPVVGQGDLHLGNLLFERQLADGNWELRSVVDFNHARISSAAEELRYTRLWHSEVTQAAKTGWEDETGQTLPDEELRLWHEIQCVTSCVLSIIERGRISDALVADMQQCFPEADWTTTFSQAEHQERVADQARQRQRLTLAEAAGVGMVEE